MTTYPILIGVIIIQKCMHTIILLKIYKVDIITKLDSLM